MPNRGELPQYYATETHPAIIDEATFEAAQQALERIAAQKPASKPKSSNAERRDNKRRLDAIERKLEKVRDEPVRLEAELHTLDPTDFEALLAKQAEIADARKLVDELESEWLVLIDLV